MQQVATCKKFKCWQLKYKQLAQKQLTQRLVYKKINSCLFALFAVLSLVCNISALAAEADASHDDVEEYEEVILRVREVTCPELKTLTCRLVASQLGLYPKAEFTQEELENLNRNLMHLSNFQKVSLDVVPLKENGEVKIIVRAVENIGIKTEAYGGVNATGVNVATRTAFRISDHGLTGKNHVWDLDMQRYWSNKDPALNSTQINIRFIDMVLTNDLFLVSNLEYLDRHRGFDVVDRYSRRRLGADAMLGYRFLGYFYTGVGAGIYPVGDQQLQFLDENRKLTQRSERVNTNVFAEVGAAFEDDPYFPTSGTRANVRVTYLGDTGRKFGDMILRSEVGYGFRYLLPLPDQSFAVFKVGGTPKNQYRPTMEQDNGITIGFGHDFDGEQQTTKMRLYFEGGFGSMEPHPVTNIMTGWIARAGMRLRTETLGLIELYVLTSTE